MTEKRQLNKSEAKEGSKRREQLIHVHWHFETPLLRAQSGSGELRAKGTWLSKLMG
jgi:hypothetical protein